MTGTHALYGPLWVMLGVATTLLVSFVLAIRWLMHRLRVPGPAFASMEARHP